MSLKITNIKIPVVAGIITLLAAAVMVKLGFWQLDRAAQKQALFADYQQQVNQPTRNPARLNQLERTPQRFEFVAVEGQFDRERYFLVDNKLQNGVPGYHVVGLLQPVSGSGYIPVNLGWIKAPRRRSEFPAVSLPQNRVTIEGLVKHPEQNLFIDNEREQSLNEWPQRVPEFIPEYIAKAHDIKLAPYVVLLSADQGFGYSRDWQPNVMPPEKHQAYALQWFSLAIVALVIFVFAVIKANKQQ